MRLERSARCTNNDRQISPYAPLWCACPLGTLHWTPTLAIKYPFYMNTKFIDEIARQISEGLPAGLVGMQQDVKKNIRTLVESALSKLDLVTREEFDLQTEVLARTRQKLEALEKRLDEQKADKKPD